MFCLIICLIRPQFSLPVVLAFLGSINRDPLFVVGSRFLAPFNFNLSKQPSKGFCWLVQCNAWQRKNFNFQFPSKQSKINRRSHSSRLRISRVPRYLRLITPTSQELRKCVCIIDWRQIPKLLFPWPLPCVFKVLLMDLLESDLVGLWSRPISLLFVQVSSRQKPFSFLKQISLYTLAVVGSLFFCPNTFWL